MDEFVDWDKAGDNVGMLLDHTGPLPPSPPDHIPTNIADQDIDLMLANVDDDDFSFWALQHFSEAGQEGQDAPLGSTSAASALQMDLSAGPAPEPYQLPNPLPDFFWYTPAVPCTSCSRSGLECKRIREGEYKGFCTSCVALWCPCSFAPSVPANNWSNDLSEDPVVTNDKDIPSSKSLLKASLSSASLEMAPPPTVPPVQENTVPAAAGAAVPNKNSPPPKIGARFSRESVKILKTWLSGHNRHPYPSDEEKEMLQRQTGLNKTQITNWLANARRRGKIQPPRSTSPATHTLYAGAVDIPRRPGTPAFDKGIANKNPLERWVDSPPDNEPASVTAIARAVASNSDMSSGLNSPHSFAFTDDGSGRSLVDYSSTSSVGTSSGGSFASAYSHASRGSFGSFSSMQIRGRRRRRRRAAPQRGPDDKTNLAAQFKTFQCTFCTETFRTKHDWQRHEKSLHLSLERWVCAPKGPRALNPATNQVSCVYCGEVDPDNEHIESHNHTTCQERSLEERTFYRKDHLNQHLRLVHNVKFMDWCMKTWKVATPEIRSRCGFCGIIMDNWSIRVDHLAEHFKMGNTMADWKGDWGFEAPVLDMVENSIPPYLIDHERNTPFPYVAGGSPPESPRSAYELIKMELAFFMMNHEDKTGALPNDDEMLLEACRIIFASEVLSLQGIDSNFSWLRDLFMSSPEVARQAQFGPLRSAIENRLSILKINGKDNLFEACPLEKQLRDFVSSRTLLGLTPIDDELQVEACCIVGRIEEASTTPSDFIANWLVRFINSSTGWLANFRQRAHLPRTEDIKNAYFRSTDTTKIDSTIHIYSRLETSLSEYMEDQRVLGIEPTDEDLQRRARIIIYEFDDGWNQTAADSLVWLNAFRERHPPGGSFSQTQDSLMPNASEPAQTVLGLQQPLASSPPRSKHMGGATCMNDSNRFRRLARELRRFVTQTTSPNNPNQHVPSDQELQHQARWIMYDDDDPWNQTPADNAEWLQRFKRDAGLLAAASPLDPSQNVVPSRTMAEAAASSCPFNPKINFSTPFSTSTTLAGTSPSSTGEGTRDQAVADAFFATFDTRHARPGTIFCARELEDSLVGFVHSEAAAGREFPSDEVLRAKAREVMGAVRTAADDETLLGKFKAWVVAEIAGEGEQQRQAFTDREIEGMLAEMEMEYGGEIGGGASLV
ncbi:conserved hypothetical protein [Verticillium alfalfae VaMs.102]|uniref:Homeobox and C2H2 transcription factor n=1 Tax=Verticillium alfalfae (strain VaMs.102 / ATCC MYA-4576 / FGSC 10136) TaxID=526221 RepID=C9S7I6_VERA1|nr:conserved hypothetical protein [Verticillium alfalfae VaMs.102]EEY14747.1 conserved hypothetical protein [Verticillium alfalfae VaMs.102]